MPCISPILVTNPTRHYAPGVDKSELYVPCGKCVGCRLDNQTSWFVRNFIEFKHAKENGGFSVFPLLTYREKNVPRFSIISPYKCNDYCFNYKDIKKFLNSLKRWAHRCGFTFSYFIASEYGGFYTKRPHYHALFNVVPGSSNVTPLQFIAKIKQLWHYGAVSPKKNEMDLIVKHFKACQYVAKYVCKDLEFFGRSSVIALQKDKELLDKCKHCLPNHYQSNGYGASYIEELLKCDDPYKKINDGLYVDFSNKNYRLPSYVINKLCYDFENDGRYDDGKVRYRRVLNDFGIKYKITQLDSFLDKKCQQLKHDFSFMHINNIMSVNKMHENVFDIKKKDYNICDKLYINYGITSPNQLKDYIDNLLGGRDLRHLALYQLAYQGKEVLFTCPDTIKDLSDLYVWQLLHPTGTEYLNHTHKLFHHLGNSYGELPEFTHYDELLSILRLLKSSFGKTTQSALAYKYLSQKRLKDFFNYVTK